MAAEEEFTYKVVTEDDYPAVKAFLDEAFFPDEPMFKATKLMVNTGSLVDYYIASLVKKFLVMSCLKDSTSIVAVDKNGDIVGSRLGTIFDRSQIHEDPDLDWLASLPNWCTPQKLITLGMTLRFLKEAKYGKPVAFEDVPEATKIYHGHSLTVSPKARGRGLGKTLLLRTMSLAKERGCSHVYIMATSVYSQKIFHSLQFTVLHETEYQGFKDKDGTSAFFKDMEPKHKSAQVVLYNLSKPFPAS